jgi:hypothetical protein
MTPYLLLTACAASGLLVFAQKVVPAPNPLSARRSMCLADRPHPAGHPGTRETRRRDDLALPQAHALGSRCRARMIRGPTFGKQPILWTSRRSLELLRRAGPGHGPHVLVVSLAAQSMRAHAERCRAPPAYGSLVRWSGTDFAELPGSPQSYPEHKRHCFEDTRPIANFPARNINFPASGSRNIHTRVPQDPRL